MCVWVYVFSFFSCFFFIILDAQLAEDYDFDKGFICKEATNRQEAKQLIEQGFEYVMDKDGVSLFKKLK